MQLSIFDDSIFGEETSCPIPFLSYDVFTIVVKTLHGCTYLFFTSYYLAWSAMGGSESMLYLIVRPFLF